MNFEDAPLFLLDVAQERSKNEKNS
jgi:hypothetical protein